MKAKVGDWLVIEGTTIDQPEQQGLIIEVHSPDGLPPYVVERALHRFGAMQSAIHYGKSE